VLEPEDAETMANWAHGGGFSLDASMRIEGADRPGLERLLRYCARPAFALERLREAALIPPPRRHRDYYYGVLAPNAPLRGQVTALAGVPNGTPAVEATESIAPTALRQASRQAARPGGQRKHRGKRKRSPVAPPVTLGRCCSRGSMRCFRSSVHAAAAR